MNPVRKLRLKAEYAALLGAAALFRTLPIAAMRGGAAGLGWLAGDILKVRRSIALENLQRAFPELSQERLDELYRSVWKHFAGVGAELARLPRMGLAEIREAVEEKTLDVAYPLLERGKGVVFVSGHIGNWEWMGAYTARAGIPMTYVVAGQSNRLVEEWLDRMRIAAGVEIVNRRDSARAILQALKRGRLVAMLSDQDAGPGGVFTEFFGKPASTPRGPALFHLRTGAPLLFGSCTRQPNGRYLMHFEELIPPPPTGERERDELAVMQVITSRLEAEIRRYPEQYLWLHRRWKTAPAASPLSPERVDSTVIWK